MNAIVHFSPTVLIAERDADVLDLIAFEVRELGYNTEVAQDFSGAEHILTHQKTDLVLTDLDIVSSDGRSLLEYIKQRVPKPPCVVFASTFSDMPVEDAFRRGADAVFAKPINYSSLSEYLKNNLHWDQIAHKVAFYRIDLTMDIRYCSITDPKRWFNSTITNLGRGGFFIRCEEDWPGNEEIIAFSLSFPDGNYSPIEGQAQVRWSRRKNVNGEPLGFGVQILSLVSEESETHLINLLNAVKTQGFIGYGA